MARRASLPHWSRLARGRRASRPCRCCTDWRGTPGTITVVSNLTTCITRRVHVERFIRSAIDAQFSIAHGSIGGECGRGAVSCRLKSAVDGVAVSKTSFAQRDAGRGTLGHLPLAHWLCAVGRVVGRERQTRGEVVRPVLELIVCFCIRKCSRRGSTATGTRSTGAWPTGALLWRQLRMLPAAAGRVAGTARN